MVYITGVTGLRWPGQDEDDVDELHDIDDGGRKRRKRMRVYSVPTIGIGRGREKATYTRGPTPLRGRRRTTEGDDKQDSSGVCGSINIKIYIHTHIHTRLAGAVPAGELVSVWLWISLKKQVSK